MTKEILLLVVYINRRLRFETIPNACVVYQKLSMAGIINNHARGHPSINSHARGHLSDGGMTRTGTINVSHKYAISKATEAALTQGTLVFRDMTPDPRLCPSDMRQTVVAYEQLQLWLAGKYEDDMSTFSGFPRTPGYAPYVNTDTVVIDPTTNLIHKQDTAECMLYAFTQDWRFLGINAVDAHAGHARVYQCTMAGQCTNTRNIWAVAGLNDHLSVMAYVHFGHPTDLSYIHINLFAYAAKDALATTIFTPDHLPGRLCLRQDIGYVLVPPARHGRCGSTYPFMATPDGLPEVAPNVDKYIDTTHTLQIYLLPERGWKWC